MRVRYWGVRGSIPVPGPSTVAVGGNTPCVSVKLGDGTLLIVDGGTGLRRLGQHLMTWPSFRSGRGRATALFSHRHWDHIQGIPFFEPAYVEGNVIDAYLPPVSQPASSQDEDLIALQYNPVNFPVPADKVRSVYRLHTARAEEPFEIGAARIHPVRLNHAGHTLGYVISESGTARKAPRAPVASLAYLADSAPWEGPLLGAGMAEESEAGVAARLYRDRVVRAAGGADLVIADTFFDENGYAGRESWGHSTPEQFLALCRDAGARRMHLFHYAPDMDDESVSRLERQTRASASGVEVVAATEGLEVELP